MVLQTNTELSARDVAIKYKQLWQVEAIFRTMKSQLTTRPIFHKCDDTIRGHVFCSFLALLLRDELQRRLQERKWQLEWPHLPWPRLTQGELRVEFKPYTGIDRCTASHHGGLQ